MIKLVAGYADSQAGFSSFFQGVEEQLLFFYSKTQSKVNVVNPDECQYTRRIFCEGYIQEITSAEERQNACYTEQLANEEEDFDLRKQQLLPTEEFYQQKGRFTALKAQKLVQDELNQLFGFAHLPFCPLFNEGRIFVPNRWFTVLSTTPYAPDFNPVSEQESVQFKKQLEEFPDLDSFLFYPDTAPTPLIKRFTLHLLEVKDRRVIAPILERYSIRQEIIQDFQVVRTLESAKASDRAVLLMNELLDAVKVCRNLQSAEMQKKINEVHKFKGSMSEDVTRVNQVALQVFSELERGFKKLCSSLFLVDIWMKTEFSTEDVDYALQLRERARLLERLQDRVQDRVHDKQVSAETGVRQGHQRSNSIVLRMKSLSLGVLAPAAPPPVLCLETPLPKQEQGGVVNHTAEQRQVLQQKSELYNRLEAYRLIFKKYITDFKKFFPPNHETVRTVESLLR